MTSLKHLAHLVLTLIAAFASAHEFQRLAAGRAQADVPALLVCRYPLRAGNRHRPLGRSEQAVDLAGRLAIGRVVGLDDDGVFCRRQHAAIGECRQGRCGEAGDASQYG